MNMKAITTSEMRAIDINSTCLGMDPLQLMENAGAGIAREIISNRNKATILFVAGRGNNGGDAFVAARHLAFYNEYKVKVILIGREKQIRTREARTNFDLLRYSGIDEIKEMHGPSDLRNYQGWKKADIIVDAILGSGIKGLPEEPEATAIELINAAGAFVISVDIPSGYSRDGNSKHVKADLILTFHKMKTELLASKDITGDIKVLPIGICKDAEEYVGPGDLKNLIARKPTAHKGEAGKVLIIGGGPYTGAPVLAALAALRTGADLVTLAVPEIIADTVAGFSPDIIVTRGLDGDKLCPMHVPKISSLIDKNDVVIIGPGLGKDEATLEAVQMILPMCKKAVIDADALSCLPHLSDKNRFIITPHGTEFSRLSGEEDVQGSLSLEERKRLVQTFAKERNVVTVLKGSIDVISDGVQTKTNRTGNAGMTVGGTGDVLAGIVGALFAVNDAFHAACCGCFVNGAAGDLAFEENGYGLLASDVIKKIPCVMK